MHVDFKSFRNVRCDFETRNCKKNTHCWINFSDLSVWNHGLGMEPIHMFYSGNTIGYNLFQQFIDLVPYFIFTAVAFVCAWGIGQLLGNLYIILLSKSMIFSGVYMGLILIFKLPEARIIKSGIKKIGVNL